MAINSDGVQLDLSSSPLLDCQVSLVSCAHGSDGSGLDAGVGWDYC